MDLTYRAKTLVEEAEGSTTCTVSRVQDFELNARRRALTPFRSHRKSGNVQPDRQSFIDMVTALRILMRSNRHQSAAKCSCGCLGHRRRLRATILCITPEVARLIGKRVNECVCIITNTERTVEHSGTFFFQARPELWPGLESHGIPHSTLGVILNLGDTY